ncbi:dicarboxylate/amino acid:cation symporter [Nesterenkonia sp. CL21]|uniref:dicarboxylate/amino acid:cation symporter n=1 Tax=Nesterenkonia sp. CL21 TaxID=3064894 RepID=UPI00287B5A0A|nr:dicarboxylate/amino acid:cation symporter [Nesterenkonia sp. CL21]MDS2173194.1 dicarboxylate/amino acid:cation symporter [Nesterenkonia sp. CL21]
MTMAGSSPSRTDAGEPTASRRSLWRWYLDVPLIWKLGVALVLGVVAGLVVGPPIAVVQPLGDIFLRLLTMLVMPLILLTLMAGVASVSPKTLGRIGGKAFLYYLVTTAFAMTIGIGVALLVSPGTGLSLPGDAEVDEQTAPPLAEVLTGIVPDNIFSALAEGEVLAVMFFALAAGVALAFMQDSTDDRLAGLAMHLRRFVDGGVELVFLIIRGVLQYSPIGVFALIAVVVGETGADALLPLASLTGVVYGGIVLQIVIYALILLLFRAPVGRFFREAKEPMLTGFVTRSSSGTLPVTTQAAERLGVRRGVYSFTLPLGATINMDGTAIYVGAATVFIANVTGTQLTLTQLATVAAVGVLASIGTAGVPGAGLIMLTMAVTAAGLPMAPVALVAGIDAILDMARTLCNVTGDLTGTRIIAKTEPGMLVDPDAPPEDEDEAEHAGEGPAGSSA